MSGPIRVEVSLRVNTVIGLLIVAGVACIWLGLEYSHAIAGIFGGLLIIIAAVMFSEENEKDRDLREKLALIS